MKLKEEKDLQLITEEYSKAIEFYRHKNYKKAMEIFVKIVSNYKNSEFYSVLEIQTRSKIYLSIAQSILNPKKIELKSTDDYIWEGIFQLNCGKIEKALEYLQKAYSKNENNPYLLFILSIAFLKKGELEETLRLLEKCIQVDQFYKIIAYNEPDFETLRENNDFLVLVE